MVWCVISHHCLPLIIYNWSLAFNDINVTSLTTIVMTCIVTIQCCHSITLLYHGNYTQKGKMFHRFLETDQNFFKLATGKEFVQAIPWRSCPAQAPEDTPVVLWYTSLIGLWKCHLQALLVCVICSNSHVMLGSLITGEDIITHFLTVLRVMGQDMLLVMLYQILFYCPLMMLYMDNCIGSFYSYFQHYQDSGTILCMLLLLHLYNDAMVPNKYNLSLIHA